VGAGVTVTAEYGLTDPNGRLNDPQGESGLARNRSRGHRASFRRFRTAGEDPVFCGGYTPTELTTEAAVTLEPEGKYPTRMKTTFARMAGDAEKNCPVSKVLDAAIKLDAKLI
jgi:hypothetical protein